MLKEIERAKGEFLQAKARLTASLATTADDRLNWSPAPSARTPIQVAAHAAWVVGSLRHTLDGRTYQAASMADADREFREWEAQFSTREQVLDLLEQNGADYLAWLETLTPERLEQLVDLPFALGQVPVGVGLSFIPAHTAYHVAQIDYIQTIYGDRDWHG